MARIRTSTHRYNLVFFNSFCKEGFVSDKAGLLLGWPCIQNIHEYLVIPQNCIRRAQFIHAAGTSILESGLKVHHCIKACITVQFYLEHVFKCACVLKFLLFLASRRIPCFVWCKTLATTHRLFVISNETVPIFCHSGGKRTLTIFTICDDHCHSNTQKQWFSWCKKGSAVS